MKILRLAFCNLNSLRGEFSVDFTVFPFESAGLFAVTGPTGAGKSTVFDAVSLSLYGETPRLRKRGGSGEGIYEIVSRHTAYAWAEVDFQVPSGRYRARWETHRARGSVKGAFQQPRMRLQRIASGGEEKEELLEEKLSEVPARVAELTGLDFTRFTRSMLLAQGAFSAFLEASPAERAELLEKMTGSFIYSEVSRLAFERAKEEEQKEADLKRRLEELPLLDEASHQQLEVSLASLLERRGDSLSARDQLIATLEKSRRKKYLISEKEKLGKQLSIMDARQAEMAELRTALEMHDKVLPSRGELNHLERLKKQETELSGRIELLSSQAAKVAQEESQLLRQAGTSVLNVDAKKAELKRILLVQQEADKISLALADLDARLEDEKNRQTEISMRMGERESELQSCRDRIAEIDLELPGHETVTDNRALAGISEEIGLIRIRLDEAVEAKKSLVVLDEDIRSCRIELSDLESEITAAGSNEGPENQLKTCRNQLKDVDRRLASLPERKQLSEGQKALEVELSALQLFNENRVEQDKIKAERSILGEKLALLDKEISSLQQHSAALKELLEAQKSSSLAAAAAALRENLRRGRPCPVCGSKEHPSSHQGELFDSFSGDEESKDEHDGVEEEYRQSLVRLAELGEARKHLLQADAKKEEELQSLSAGLEDIPGDPAELEKRISRLEEQRELLDSLEAERTDLFHRLGELTEYEREQSSFVEKKRNDAVLRRERLGRLEQDKERMLEAASLADSFIEKHLVPAGIDPAAANAAELVESSVVQFRQAADSRKVLSGEKQALLEKALLFEKEAAVTGSELETAAERVQDLTTRRNELSGGLEVLTGGKDADMMVSAAESELKSAEEADSSIRQQLSSLREEAARLKGLGSGAEESREQGRVEQKSLESLLMETAGALGFDSLNGFAAALLNDYSQRRQELDEYESRRSELVREAGVLDTELTSLGDVTSDITILEGNLRSLDEELEKLQQEQFSMMQQLEKEKENRALRESLEKELEDQSREYSLWWRLKQVIGSARGDSFRRFAQGLTLDFLIRLANGHLKRFSGRYRLQRQQGDDLALEICDTWQADTVRPVATLSGGETFLVSLSLALGLSELAGRKTRIDSLFLDEGFGTLDAETLETVLAALDTLQSGGKLIGVISHVEVLKERIPVQIQISRRGAGSSTLFVVPEPVA